MEDTNTRNDSPEEHACRIMNSKKTGAAFMVRFAVALLLGTPFPPSAAGIANRPKSKIPPVAQSRIIHFAFIFPLHPSPTFIQRTGGGQPCRGGSY
jgi:hypothetical protein